MLRTPRSDIPRERPRLTGDALTPTIPRHAAARRSTPLRAVAPLAIALSALLAFPAAASAQDDPDTVEDTVVVDTVEAEEPAAEAPPRGRTQRGGDVVSVFGGSRTIGPDDVVGDAVVLGGSLHVRGTVTGDAVVLGGSLTTYEGSSIHGDVVVLGGRHRNQGGTIGGERVEGVTFTGPRTTETRTATAAATRGPFHRVSRALVRIISTTGLFAALMLIGAALVFYGRRYLETVSDTARGSTLRAGATGLATGLLAFPAFIFLIVALAISIIGIPLLLVVVPLYPVVLVLAIGFGLLGGAHALGERTAEQRGGAFSGHRNSYAYLLTGLAILFLPVVVGHLVGMVGFLSFVGWLLRFLGWVAIWLAATVGLGAVVLSRAGTRRTFVAPLHDVPSEPDPIIDEEFADR